MLQVDHTYDRLYVIQQLGELEELLVQLIQPHLTNKSVARIDQVGVFILHGCKVYYYCIKEEVYDIFTLGIELFYVFFIILVEAIL